jgi:hypothetical protein
MNSHELGDEYEKVCKAYLEELYSKTNPQFIDTKFDKIHGIDFAMSLNDDEIIFVIESKGKYGQVSKNQMTKEWIQKRITPDLAEKIRNNIAKNGIIKYLSFRVNNDNPDNPIIKRISPSGFLDKEDFSEFGQQNISSSNNNSTKKDTIMSNSKRSLKYQLELLISLRKYLLGFQDRLEKDLNFYEKKVTDLHEKGHMLDEVYFSFRDNSFDPSKQHMQKIMQHMNDNDLKQIDIMIKQVEEFLAKFG